MEELFIRLERQIRSLVDQQNQLQESNHQLKNSRGSLAHENAELQSRQQKAIDTIEALVSRLKAIEKTP
jgi:uncharacterized protein (TIGR02449 family)